MKNRKLYALLSAALACALITLPAFADSQARIVRLSDVQGGVQINKNAGLGFENAFLNLPLTQGAQLRTRQNGRAEIEFEDGSTLRIAPNTTVEFSTLGLNDAGKRISSVSLVEGRAYVNWLGKAGDEFTLNFSHEKVALGGAAHFRVADVFGMVEVANFKNELQVSAPSGDVKVEKKKMVAFDPTQNDQPLPAKKFDEDTYDQWDKQSVSYHEQYARNNSSPLGYGASDLNYYGSYTNFPGYGMMWQPYFAGAGWNPYMDGAWSFYPGMGYMWASAYPWGWMPYYYGNWIYASGFGWGWQPGAFNGWRGGIHYIGAPALQVPVVPKGTTSTVVVGRGGPILNQTPARSVLTSGSAGFGIARGSVSGLRQLNSQVAKTGSVQIHAAPQFAASSSQGGVGSGSGRSTANSGASARAGASSSAGHSSGGAAHR